MSALIFLQCVESKIFNGVLREFPKKLLTMFFFLSLS